MKKLFKLFSISLVIVFTLSYIACSTPLESNDDTKPAKKKVTYTITFNENNNSENPQEETQTFTKGTTQKLKTIEELGFSKDGFNFAGWAETPDASEAAYADGADYTATSNIKFYAVWTAKPTYTVTFNINDGSENPLTRTQSFKDGVEQKLYTLYSLGFTKTDRRFAGWATRPDAKVAEYLDGALFKTSTSVSLYAVWNTFMTGSEINEIFYNLSHFEATSFKASSTPPASECEYYLDYAKEIPLWYDSNSKTIYFYMNGHDKIELNADSSSMFYDMKLLETIETKYFDTSRVTDLHAMFCYCEKLSSIDLKNFDTSNVTNMNNLFTYCKTLTELDLSSFNTSKVTSMSNIFYDCTSLTKLNISSFDTSNVTNMYCMFNGCKKLEKLDLRNFNTANVTNMAFMFSGCENLTELDISKFNTSNVTNMSAMFYGCKKIEELNVSNFITSNVTDMSSMFVHCFELTKLDLSNFDTSNVTSFYGMFYWCPKLKEINIINFNTSLVENMYCMFYGCAQLTSIFVSANTDWNSETVNSSESMFKDSPNLPGYNENNANDVTYAHTGTKNGISGYFTVKQ